MKVFVTLDCSLNNTVYKVSGDCTGDLWEAADSASYYLAERLSKEFNMTHSDVAQSIVVVDVYPEGECVSDDLDAPNKTWV